MPTCPYCWSDPLPGSAYCDEHFRKIYKEPPRWAKFRQNAFLNHIGNFVTWEYSIPFMLEDPLRRKNKSTLYLDMCFKHQGRLWIIEIDEHAHRRYRPDKEQARTESLYTEQELPVNLIRINPDEYYDVLTGKLRPPIATRHEFVISTPHEVKRVKTVDLNKTELWYRLQQIQAFFRDAFQNHGEMYGETLHEGKLRLIKFFY